MQSGELERAGSSELMDVNYETANREVELVAGMAGRRLSGGERRVGSWAMILGMAGVEAGAVGVGDGASVCRKVRRSAYGRIEGVRVVAISFMAVGSLVRRSTPWRRASLPPGAGRDFLAECRSSLPAEMVMLAASSACIGARRAQICSLRTDVARLYELRAHGTTQPSNSDFAQRAYGGRVRRLAVISKMDNGYPRPQLALIKPTALAAQLGVSRTWIYDAARDGRIPSVRIGGPDGPLRFVPEDIEAWIDAARAAWRPGEPVRATLLGAARNGR